MWPRSINYNDITIFVVFDGDSEQCTLALESQLWCFITVNKWWIISRARLWQKHYTQVLINSVTRTRMGITSTLLHNVTQCHANKRYITLCVIHSNNRHRHQSHKMMGLSYPDSDFKIILVELSNTDKSLRSFPRSVIQFHLFFIFDLNISPLNSVLHNFWSFSLYSMTILCKICQLVLLMCFCWMKTFILLSHLQKNLYYFNNLFLVGASAF